MTPHDKEDLMAYFMGQTNERLIQIEQKLMELIAFKAEIMASAKATAIVVSAVGATLGIALSIFIRKMGF